MALERRFTRAWLAWLGAFVVLEWKAITRKKKGDTFSEHVWSWFKVENGNNRWAAWGLRAFLLWLLVHLGWRMF